MPERSTAAHARPTSEARSGDSPPPDVAEFIRFCYRRRAAPWPELYDEMCAVAACRAFNGWDHEDLAARGLSFSLFEMPRLAAWVRATLPSAPEAADYTAPQPAPI